MRALLAARCCFEVTYSVDISGFFEPHFASKARVSKLGSPYVINMLAPLVRPMFAFACRENEFMLLQIKGFGLGDGTGLAEESKRTKLVQEWSCQIELGTLFAICCKLFSICLCFMSV